MTEAIIGLLIYYAYVAAVGVWCRKKSIASSKAFWLGVVACLVLALVTFALVSLFFGKPMLINDDPAFTLLCALALGVLGGFRCRDQASRRRPDTT